MKALLITGTTWADVELAIAALRDAGVNVHMQEVEVVERQPRRLPMAALLAAATSFTDSIRISVNHDRIADAMERIARTFQTEAKRQACAYYADDSFREDRAIQREAIASITAWLDHFCRNILRSFITLTTPPRIVQQRCWSSRRWKSLAFRR